MKLFGSIKDFLIDNYYRAKTTPDLSKDLFIGALLIFSTIASFFLGRLSILEEKQKGALSITMPAGIALEKTGPVVANNLSQETASVSSAAIAPTEKKNAPSERGMYVGSKSGKTYHLPWCSGAQRIKEENKIWFADKADAEGRGYKPATNCKGI